MAIIKDECKCEEVQKVLEETRKSIEKEYSGYGVINADFVRTQKAMFFEKIDSLFSGIKASKEVN